jgi:hypothetical protein
VIFAAQAGCERGGVNAEYVEPAAVEFGKVLGAIYQ